MGASTNINVDELLHGIGVIKYNLRGLLRRVKDEDYNSETMKARQKGEISGLMTALEKVNSLAKKYEPNENIKESESMKLLEAMERYPSYTIYFDYYEQVKVEPTPGEGGKPETEWLYIPDSSGAFENQNMAKYFLHLNKYYESCIADINHEHMEIMCCFYYSDNEYTISEEEFAEESAEGYRQEDLWDDVDIMYRIKEDMAAKGIKADYKEWEKYL